MNVVVSNTRQYKTVVKQKKEINTPIGNWWNHFEH